MFWPQPLIILVLFLAGCATASEPPVQQAVVTEPAQWATVEQAISGPPPVVVEKPQELVAPQPKRSVAGEPQSAVLETPPNTSVVAQPKAAPKAASIPDDNAIIRYVLAESRARYRGNCACPDDRDRAGRRCGGRSAYSRPGGYAPLCYPRDVTPEMIEKARREARL